MTGGYRYRGSALPGMQGAYVFADYCNNTIRVLSLTGNTAKEISSVKVESAADRVVRAGREG